MSSSALPPHDQEMTLVQHLLELRNSMTKGILAILVAFLALFPFANELYTYISEPLTRFLPAGTSMIATGVASPFLTPFKLSLVLGVYVAMPVLLYQAWRFIAPALYSHEKQLVAPILFFSSFLFYAGGAFAFYVVFPLVFGFLSTTAPQGVTIATDISLYLDFVIKMFFA
ncbi:MAG: twin-arginine translocase subunit TatC, partial [Thiotrichales bacterium]|nr:twin-arginine translocase subunit TatC [Thiotrichales bacterium]